MAEFQVRNPPGLNESTNGIIPRLNASSFPVSGVVSDHITVPASASVASVATVERGIVGSDDESVEYLGESNKKKSSEPNAKYGSSTRPITLLSDQSDEKPGAFLDKNKNSKNKSYKASVSTKVILQHKIFLTRNKRLVLKRKSRPIVKVKIGARSIPSNSRAIPHEAIMKSSTIKIKEENQQTSRKRKSEDISQSIKSERAAKKKNKSTFPAITYTEKQRIQRILRKSVTNNVSRMNYPTFCKSYMNMYGEKLNVNGTIVREFISTIPPWKVTKLDGALGSHFYLVNQNMTDGDKSKSNNNTGSSRYELQDLVPTAVPSNDWAWTSSIAIKEETNVSSRKRKSDDIPQAKKSIKTKTDPSPQKMKPSSTLSSTEKQRIRNILQTLAADNVQRIDYSQFRKTYQEKYGESLHVEGTIIREFMNTISSWQVKKSGVKHYYIENHNMTDIKKENKPKSNHGTSSSPHNTKITTTRSSTAATLKISSVSGPNDSRITTLLEKQMDLSKKILEAQLKKNKLDEKQVLLSKQLLEAQLKNNELDEDCNAILLLNSVNEAAATTTTNTRSEEQEEMFVRLRDLQQLTATRSTLDH